MKNTRKMIIDPRQDPEAALKEMKAVHRAGGKVVSYRTDVRPIPLNDLISLIGEDTERTFARDGKIAGFRRNGATTGVLHKRTLLEDYLKKQEAKFADALGEIDKRFKVSAKARVTQPLATSRATSQRVERGRKQRQLVLELRDKLLATPYSIPGHKTASKICELLEKTKTPIKPPRIRQILSEAENARK